MALIDKLKEFGKYELGLEEWRILRELRAEVKELKTKYGFSDRNSYNAWRDDDDVSINDKQHFKFHLDEIWNAARGLALKYGISAAEISLVTYQILPQISKGDYLGAVGRAAVILGMVESLKGVVHHVHGDEYRLNNLLIDAFGITKT